MKYYIESKLFRIKEDFWIRNEKDECSFFVDRKILSLGEQFDILEKDQIIYTAKQKLLTFMPTYEIFNSNGEVVAKVNQKINLIGDKIIVDSKYGDFLIKGDLFNYSYSIYNEKNVPVAKIEKRVFALSDKYDAWIYFEDKAFMLALVIIVDNIIDMQKH